MGQVSRDIGVRFTTKTWNLLTHRIDPDMDDARDYLTQSLLLSHRVAKVGHVRGATSTLKGEPRRNLTGDPYETDGLRAVLAFSKELTPISRLRTFPWDWPDSLTIDGAVPWRNAD